MNSKIVQLELQLMLLKYGRRAVLEALAAISEQTLEQIEQQVSAAAQKKATSSRKKPPSITELADDIGKRRPEISEPIHAIAGAFESKSFLPHLRDAQRFLEKIDAHAPKLKSRAAAVPFLIEALAKLSPDELGRILTKTSSSGKSDYSLLSQAIMGTSPDRQREE